MERMEKPSRIASDKPHFFQPILPGFTSAHNLAIPKSFQSEYLADKEDSEGVATLISPLKSWKVKLNGFKFTDGWADFFVAHKLRMGNFLVFQYGGYDLIFHVWVFSTSYCEVEYSSTPSLLMSEGQDENEMNHGHSSVERIDRSETSGKSRAKSKSKGKSKGKVNGKVKKKQTYSKGKEYCEETDDGDEELNDDATSISKYPHFYVTLKSYNLGRSYLAIPVKFWKPIISNEVETVSLKDEEGKEWSIKLNRQRESSGLSFGFGWFDFTSAKGLQVGDICLFEQEDSDKLEFTVHIIRK